MKITVLMAMAAVIGTTAWAGSTEREVTVCFDKANAGDVADGAQVIASKMFRNIGLKLEWHEAGHFCRTHKGQVIAITVSTQTPRTLLPGALAYALPYEGVHIEVFYDRMDHADADLLPYLLAHVLVHEITHILQGVNTHSGSGIMKAHWERDDCSHMATKPLGFTDADVNLINTGLDARASHLAPGTLAAANSVPRTVTAGKSLQ